MYNLSPRPSKLQCIELDPTKDGRNVQHGRARLLRTVDPAIERALVSKFTLLAPKVHVSKLHKGMAKTKMVWFHAPL